MLTVACVAPCATALVDGRAAEETRSAAHSGSPISFERACMNSWSGAAANPQNFQQCYSGVLLAASAPSAAAKSHPLLTKAGTW
jgi:hypothetical protein